MSDTGERVIEPPPIDSLLSRISGEAFSAWYREQQEVNNIREGRAYLNSSPEVGPPERFSPSKLLQCQRKSYYNHYNSPQESYGGADGIFWFGTKFEEELAVPFLQNIVGDNPQRFIQNSIWVEFEIPGATNQAVIRGLTDPVIVDREGAPILLTEIKTKESVDRMSEPNRHHVAQAHAYMYGLTEKFDRRITDAVLVYGSRKSLSARTFHIEFDPWFWRERVMAWVEKQAAARGEKKLPPADPEFEWECSYCPYQERCGQTNSPINDSDAWGFVPLVVYQKDRVLAYLESCKAESHALTPTLAWHYPELSERWDVFDWRCVACGSTYEWESIEWDGQVQSPPTCSACAREAAGAELRGPLPEEQQGAVDQ